VKVLFIGGTGLISAACTDLAARRGVELVLLNRGSRPDVDVPDGVEALTADARDEQAVAAALGDRTFDAVVNWIAFVPRHVEQDIRLFAGRTSQYVFISSASVYQKPLEHYIVTESTPLANPYWQYARDKIACEQRLMEAHRQAGFPVTIVRPSLTYGATMIPLAVNVWAKPYTAVARMKAGRKVIVPGNGSSLWTVTHNSDFAKGLVGLLGNARAVGESFHITSDEVLTWDRIYASVARAAGAEPDFAHISTEFLLAFMPDRAGSLIGDKCVSAVFDNSKIKRFVPDFAATTAFHEGIKQSVAWFEADPARMAVDLRADALWDRIIDAHESAMAKASRAT